MFTQILAAIQSSAQSSATTQNMRLELVKRLPVALVIEGSGASSSTGESGSVPPGACDGNHRVRNDVLPPISL